MSLTPRQTINGIKIQAELMGSSYKTIEEFKKALEKELGEPIEWEKPRKKPLTQKDLEALEKKILGRVIEQEKPPKDNRMTTEVIFFSKKRKKE